MAEVADGPVDWDAKFPRSVSFILVFFLLRFYRRVLMWDGVAERLEKVPLMVRRLIMPYTVFYAYLGLYVVMDLAVTTRHEFQTGGLPECQGSASDDPDFANHQWQRPGLNTTHRECSELSPALFATTLAAPIANAICYVVCAVHTLQHGAECGWGPLTYGHDMATQIASLPVVYGLLSFNSAVDIWYAMAWPDLYKKYDLQMFDVNYSVADCYEAWALFCFGRMCMLYLENASSWATEEARDLMSPMQKMLLQGLLGFCFIQTASAVYSIVVTLLEEQLCENHGWACQMDMYFTGAVFALSCLAIANMVIFETTLGSYVHGLQPKFKFIYAKCLLTITTVQRAALSLLSHYNLMTVLEVDLLYASLVCLECLLLCFFNWQAWHPKADWHEQLVANPKARPSHRTELTDLREDAPRPGAAPLVDAEVSVPVRRVSAPAH